MNQYKLISSFALMLLIIGTSACVPSNVKPTVLQLKGGFTLTSRTHQKRPIMAVEVCHAEAKKILPGVQTGGC